MLNLLCAIFGHNWKMIQDFDLDSGWLKSVDVNCSKCGATAGRHYVQHALSREELEQHRQAWKEVSDGLARLNRCLGD